MADRRARNPRPGGEDAVFTYDADVSALHYRLTREPVARTIDIDGRVMVDVDLDAPGFSGSVLPSGGFTPWAAGITCGTTCAICGRADCSPAHSRHREEPHA